MIRHTMEMKVTRFCCVNLPVWWEKLTNQLKTFRILGWDRTLLEIRYGITSLIRQTTNIILFYFPLSFAGRLIQALRNCWKIILKRLINVIYIIQLEIVGLLKWLLHISHHSKPAVQTTCWNFKLVIRKTTSLNPRKINCLYI